MKPNEFEKQLEQAQFRPVPAAWRDEILKAARNAAPERPEVRSWWRELLWPCPQAWAGLAAAWVLILATQFDASSPTEHGTAASQTAKARVLDSGEAVITAGLSERAWAKLIDFEEPVEPPKPAIVPRRSHLQRIHSYEIV